MTFIKKGRKTDRRLQGHTDKTLVSASSSLRKKEFMRVNDDAKATRVTLRSGGFKYHVNAYDIRKVNASRLGLRLAADSTINEALSGVKEKLMKM